MAWVRLGVCAIGASALLWGACSAAGVLDFPEEHVRPDFRLSDLEGRQHRLAEYRNRVVLVNFWASWCAPCIEEMPSIQRLAETMRGRPFSVIAVNVGESKLRVKTAAQRLKIQSPVLLDTDSGVFRRWGATLLPTSYLLDGTGAVHLIGQGVIEWDGAEIVDTIGRLMEAAAGAQ